MSLNIKINIDLSQLSEEAIRAKLANLIDRIQQEYVREEAEEEEER